MLIDELSLKLFSVYGCSPVPRFPFRCTRSELEANMVAIHMMHT